MLELGDDLLLHLARNRLEVSDGLGNLLGLVGIQVLHEVGRQLLAEADQQNRYLAPAGLIGGFAILERS